MEALNDFKGGLILVSHDARLISEVCDQIWVCGTDQTVTIFDGTFEEYREQLVAVFERKLFEEEEARAKKEQERRKKREEDRLLRQQQKSKKKQK